MRRALLALQFPFIVLPTILIGLVVYGVDFKDSYIGVIYAILLLALIFLPRFGFISSLDLGQSRNTNSVLALLGSLSAAVLYRPLHLGIWNEHDIAQAFLVSIVGLVSSILSSQASKGLSYSTSNIIAPFLVIALIWLAAFFYPLVGFLFVIVIFSFVVISGRSASDNHNRSAASYIAQQKVLSLRSPKTLLVTLLAMETSLVVWDYDVKTTSGSYLFGVFLITPLGWLLRNHLSSLLTLIIGLISWLILSYWLPYSMELFIHPLIMGVALGWLLRDVNEMVVSNGNPSDFPLSRFSFFWVAGWILGNWFASNLAYLDFKLIFWLICLVAAFITNKRLRNQNASRELGQA